MAFDGVVGLAGQQHGLHVDSIVAGDLFGDRQMSFVDAGQPGVDDLLV